MPIAVSYLRFSSAQQQHGDSLRRQQEAIGRWMQQHPEFVLSNITYDDLGVSGWSGKHKDKGELGKLVEAVESGDIPSGSVVLVEALDRFSRLPPMETLNLLNSIVSKGVDLITLEDSQRYDASGMKDNRLFILVVKAQAANEYSDRLSTRVRASFEGRAERAKAGQVIKRRNGFWLTSEGHLKPDEAAIVHDVFTSFTQGIGIRALARKHSDSFANPASVRKLLTNIATIGHWQRYDSDRQPTELIKHVFEPAIEPVLFYQAQEMIKKSPTLTHPRKNPLAGIVICSECGGNFAKRNASPKSPTASMGCYTRMLNKAKCDNSKNYPMPVLGHVFWETAKGHVYKAMQKARLSDVEKERITLQGEIDSVKQRQIRLISMMDSIGDDETLTTQYKALRTELDGLQTRLASLPSDSSEVTISLTEFYAMMNGDPIARAKTLQAGGYRIVCDNKGAMTVDGDRYTYLRYVRKFRTWLFQLPDGSVCTTDER